MTDQRTQQEKPRQPDPAEIYGAQGNEGQYGQGQYDSEGRPDPHGPQAQKIHPDDQATQKKTPATETAKQDKKSQQQVDFDGPMD